MTNNKLNHAESLKNSNDQKLILARKNSNISEVLTVDNPLNIENLEDTSYRNLFKSCFESLLNINLDFSSLNITKENSHKLLEIALFYNQDDMSANDQFKINLINLLKRIDNNDLDSLRILEQLNSIAKDVLSANHSHEISKRIFPILTTNLTLSQDVRSSGFDRGQDPAAGVFAMKEKSSSAIQKNTTHQLFLKEILSDGSYGKDFADQAGQNLEKIIYHLFFDSNNQELRDLLGEKRYNELQEKLTNSSLDSIPPIDSDDPAYFVTPDTLDEKDKINAGALLNENALSMGIFSGVKLKLGLKINPDGSKEQGLFDEQGKLLIDHQSLIEMYKKSGFPNDKALLVETIVKSGFPNNDGNVSSTYFETTNDLVYSFRMIGGRSYLGIFKVGLNDQIEFQGALLLNGEVSYTKSHNDTDSSTSIATDVEKELERENSVKSNNQYGNGDSDQPSPGCLSFIYQKPNSTSSSQMLKRVSSMGESALKRVSSMKESALKKVSSMKESVARRVGSMGLHR